MTLLFWDYSLSVGGSRGPLISTEQKENVERIVAKYDCGFKDQRPFQKGQTFLFDGNQHGTNVDPEGLMAAMIGEFDRSEPKRQTRMNSTRGFGSRGLHVTAGLSSGAIDFENDSELLERHSKTSWVDGKRGWELPLTLICTCKMAPIHANAELFQYLMKKGEQDRKFAIFAIAVGKHALPINSSNYASAGGKKGGVGSVDGIGHTGQKEISAFFERAGGSSSR